MSLPYFLLTQIGPKVKQGENRKRGETSLRFQYFRIENIRYLLGLIKANRASFFENHECFPKFRLNVTQKFGVLQSSRFISLVLSFQFCVFLSLAGDLRV